MSPHDAAQAEVLVFTFKEGALSALAHDLKISVTKVELDTTDDAITARFDAHSLRVVCPRKEGRDNPGVLPTVLYGEIEKNIVKEVLESAKRSSAVIYAVTAAEARRRSPLTDLTDATGGHMLPVAANGDLRGAFQKILQDFRSRYILAYSPQGVPNDGFHRLEVRVKRRGLTVKARPGYVGVGTARKVQ